MSEAPLYAPLRLQQAYNLYLYGSRKSNNLFNQRKAFLGPCPLEIGFGFSRGRFGRNSPERGVRSL